MTYPTENQPSPSRIASIDALRGLTILVMIFVNDLAGVNGVPTWMKHMAPEADGMTFVDVVFPAFLFIVGMSVPLALGRRLDRGVRPGILWRHILTRTLGLLVIGVYMVNTEAIWDRDWGSNVWIFCMYLAVVTVWNEAPREPVFARRTAIGVRMAGIATLAVLAILYRGTSDPGFIEMQTSWWGILGLIGWAYLVACTVYMIFRRNDAAMMGMVAILYCVYLAGQTDFFAGIPVIPDYVDIGGMLGSHAAIVLSGIILGMILRPDSPIQTHGRRIRWGLLYGLGLFAAGTMLHSLHDLHNAFIVNKNMATPPWCLICSAFTAWLWTGIYWLMDVRGWTRWAAILAPAGQNPLFAYILAPILYVIFSLTGLSGLYFSTLGGQFVSGLIRSLAFTFLLTWLTGYLYRNGLRLRL